MATGHVTFFTSLEKPFFFLTQVSKVMVAEAIDITRETYFCLLLDRESGGPVLVCSPDGGVDIEEVVEKTPDRIR